MDKDKLSQNGQMDKSQSGNEVQLDGISNMENSEMEGENIAVELKTNMDALYQNLENFNTNVGGI